MDTMWLVLGQHNDIEARWVADGLRARADQPVRLVTDATLVHDCRWELRVGAGAGPGGASARLSLGDGTVLGPTTVDGVVNRLCWLGAEAFAGASDHDREYATAELYALGLGWLESLGGRVVNRPAGSGLAGPSRRTAEWRSLACTVGLPFVPYDSDDPPSEVPPFGEVDGVVSVLVVDGDVIPAPSPGTGSGGHGPSPVPSSAAGGGGSSPAGLSAAGGGSSSAPCLSPAVRDGLSALQRASGLDLLEAHLVARNDGDGALALSSVSFLPALSRFGEAGLDALHKALITRRGGGGSDGGSGGSGGGR